MIFAISQVKWLGVLAASVAHFVLGGIWFGALMRRQYVDSLSLADQSQQKPALLFLIGPFICSAATIATTAILLRALNITSYNGALSLGLLVAFGYLVPMTVNIAINPLFPRPFYYSIINAPFFIVGSLVSCVVLVALS